MRVDIHERLTAVADELLAHEDTHVVLVSRHLADALRGWSEPVQLKAEPTSRGQCGVLELICRNLDSTREDVVRSL